MSCRNWNAWLIDMIKPISDNLYQGMKGLFWSSYLVHIWAVDMGHVPICNLWGAPLEWPYQEIWLKSASCAEAEIIDAYTRGLKPIPRPPICPTWSHLTPPYPTPDIFHLGLGKQCALCIVQGALFNNFWYFNTFVCKGTLMVLSHVSTSSF